MMLANRIRQILKHHASGLGIKPNRIYAYTINPNVRANDTHDLVILITEIDDTPLNYGSNRSINREGNIQIQLFIPKTYTGDTSVLRDKINNILERNQWYCTQDLGIRRDPTANILMNTLHYRKTHVR